MFTISISIASCSVLRLLSILFHNRIECSRGNASIICVLYQQLLLLLSPNVASLYQQHFLAASNIDIISSLLSPPSNNTCSIILFIQHSTQHPHPQEVVPKNTHTHIIFTKRPIQLDS